MQDIMIRIQTDDSEACKQQQHYLHAANQARAAPATKTPGRAGYAGTPRLGPARAPSRRSDHPVGSTRSRPRTCAGRAALLYWRGREIVFEGDRHGTDWGWVCAGPRLNLCSVTDRAVNPFPEQVRMTVVAGVLLDHVDHDPAQ